MGFHEDAVFPKEISYGSRPRLIDRTAQTEELGGGREVVSLWAGPLIGYNARYGVKKPEDWSNLIAFYRARRGPAHSFRFFDHSDFSTGPNGIGTQGFLNEVVGTGDGTPQTFKLIKTYDDGSGITRTRRLTKPIDGEVRFGWDGVPKVENDDYTVDYSTGEILATVPSGLLAQAGCLFHVPMHFVDDDMEMDLRAFERADIPDILLLEDRDPQDIPEELWAGGGSEQAFTTNLLIGAAMGRVIRLDPQAASLGARMPDIDNFEIGGPAFVLENTGSNEVEIQDRQGNPLFALPADTTTQIWVFPVGTSKFWKDV